MQPTRASIADLCVAKFLPGHADSAHWHLAALPRLWLFRLRRQALTLLKRHIAAFALPNVRAEAGPTAKRQARVVENAPAHCAGLAF